MTNFRNPFGNVFTKHFYDIFDKFRNEIIEASGCWYDDYDGNDEKEFDICDAIQVYILDYNSTELYIQFLNSYIIDREYNPGISVGYDYIEEKSKLLYDCLEDEGEIWLTTHGDLNETFSLPTGIINFYKDQGLEGKVEEKMVRSFAKRPLFEWPILGRYITAVKQKFLIFLILIKSPVKKYKDMSSCCQGSVRSTDLLALDSCEEIDFMTGHV